MFVIDILDSNCNLNCSDLRISLINTVSVTFNCPMVLIMRIQSSPHTSTVDTTQHSIQPPISAQCYNHNDMYRQFPAPVCRIKRSADLRTNTKEVPRSSAGAILDIRVGTADYCLQRTSWSGTIDNNNDDTVTHTIQESPPLPGVNVM